MPKILRQNVGGIDYAMAGCALSGSCATAASDFVKVVTLSDGDTVSDGMSLAVAFTNGNAAGNAPGTTTIYSSDQVHYFSDSGLTQPFTLAPAGCYTITYTGTGNAYTYKSFPVLSVGGVTAPVCSINGRNIGASAWNAGDIGVFIYTAGKFLLVSVNLDNTTGVLPIAHGGTGQTTQADINKAFVAALGSATADVTDGTEFISSNATDNGFSETGDGGPNKPYRRQFVKVWNYIKGKISSVLGLSTTGLSTGTITTTGDINVGKGKSIVAIGTKANYSMIKFKDNTGDANGNGVVIGGGGATVIGGGESADTYYSGASLSAGSETMAVVNDGAINFVSNLQSGYANGKTMTMGTDGKLTNSQGFVGPLTGNVTGNVSGSAGSCAEANLTWGGRNWAGGNGCLDTAIVDNLRANRYAGIRAGVTIEYSRDGGSTWTSYGASTQSITQLFTTSSGFLIGKADSTNKATANGTRYQLRITIDHSSASVYSEIRKYVINVSTNGSYSCTVDIQRTLKQTPDTWANYMTGIPLSGWSGYNVIQTAFTAGYSFDNQFRKVRFIFKANGGDTNYTGLNIISIYAYGGFGWTTPTNLARNGHVYSIDVNTDGTLRGGMNINGSADSIRDSGNAHNITASYSAAGLSGVPAWLTAWSGYELRAVASTNLVYSYYVELDYGNFQQNCFGSVFGNTSMIFFYYAGLLPAGGYVQITYPRAFSKFRTSVFAKGEGTMTFVVDATSCKLTNTGSSPAFCYGSAMGWGSLA